MVLVVIVVINVWRYACGSIVIIVVVVVVVNIIR